MVRKYIIIVILFLQLLFWAITSPPDMFFKRARYEKLNSEENIACFNFNEESIYLYYLEIMMYINSKIFGSKFWENIIQHFCLKNVTAEN